MLILLNLQDRQFGYGLAFYLLKTFPMATQNTSSEFWLPHPPTTPAGSARPPMTACARCGAEFIIAASYCHVCGTARALRLSEVKSLPRPKSDTPPALPAHQSARLGVPSILALCAGLGCATLSVLGSAFVYSAHIVASSEAVQFWRIQWLLAAIAAFLMGSLLKRG
jgi:hypothetical protein